MASVYSLALAEIDRSERFYDFQMTPEEIGRTFEFETSRIALYFHEILIDGMKMSFY